MDNIELIGINAAIRYTVVEQVGEELRSLHERHEADHLISPGCFSGLCTALKNPPVPTSRHRGIFFAPLA